MKVKHVLTTLAIIASIAAFGDIGGGYARKRLAEVERRVESMSTSTNSPDGTFQDRRVQIGENAQAIGVTDGGRNQSIAIGFNAEASGMTSIAIGSGGTNYDGTANAPKARGGNSVAIGYDAEAETQAVSIGQSAKTKRGASVAIGLRAMAYGQHDVAIGTDAVVTNWFSTKVIVVTNGTEIVTNTVVTTNTYNYSVAIGKGAVVKANNSVQIGAGMNTKGNTIKFQDKYLATENYVSDNYQPKGSYLTAEVDPTVPEWAKAVNPPAETDPTVPAWAKAENPPAETDPTVPEWAKELNKPTYTASEVGAATPQDITNKFDEIGPVKSDWNINEGKTSIGSEAEATGRRSTAIGAGTKAQSPNSIVMGTYAVSTNGNQAIAIGNQANGSATNSTAIGNLAQAIDYNGIAIGSGAKANKRYSIAIGDGARSDTAIKGIAIGSNAASDSQETVVIGANASVGVRSTKSIAIGSGAKVNVNKSGANVAVQIGTGTNPDEGTIQFLDKKLATENYVDTIVASWEQFLDGSNVVFSITNYISGTYDLSAAKLRILELRPGETNYTEVYNSRDEILLHIADYNTKTVQPQIVELRGEFESGLSEKADKAWGKYTSSGGIAPSNQVYMTAPHTVFAGGMEYERVAVGEGAICVLTTKGAPVYTQGDEGSFKFQDANGTNYFGFAKTDSYVIGAETDGISVSEGIVTLEYNVTMSGVPCIWYCPSLDTLPISWEMLNTSDGSPVPGASHVVQWDEDPPVGKRVCYINCPEPKGFFRATIEEPGEAKFMTNMPADLSGGIICTNEATGVNGVIRPIFDGSSVRWEWSMK